MVAPNFGIEMVTSQSATLGQDWQAVGNALSSLCSHAVVALSFGYTWGVILQWLAVIAAM